MRNIIIVGDSFCCGNGWPDILANKLDMNLIQCGFPGNHWWAVRDFLINLKPEKFDNSDIIIFVHTHPDRIPTLTSDLSKVNCSRLGNLNEIEMAVKLYYSYIHDGDFLNWIMHKWFEEISQKWVRLKTVHLHGFQESWPYRHLLNGMNVGPDLIGISLDELRDPSPGLFTDRRRNHFNEFNNEELANQLYHAIVNYQLQDFNLDVTKFQKGVS